MKNLRPQSRLYPQGQLMPPKKKVTTPKKAKNHGNRPEEKFFNQYIWHHKVHENLGEKLRYFLLKVSPYDEDKLSASLTQLVNDKHISGLRAYRVFGRNDLMVRAWMAEKTFDEMVPSLYDYIEHDRVVLDETHPFYVQQVEYRWYWEEAPPNSEALKKDSQLMIRLWVDHSLVARIESGKAEDSELFDRYKNHGLIIPKPSTDETITFFICVSVRNTSKLNDIKQLVSLIKTEMLREERFYYPEIDSAFGGICNLMIRARATNYFAISDLIRWLSKQQPHIGGTETYLSLTEQPLCGDTNLSMNSIHAREEHDHIVYAIFDDPAHPNGPYPTRLWGKIAEEVVAYLKEKGLTDPPKGLKRFLQSYLLAAMRGQPGFSALEIFPELERHLREHHKEFIVKLKLSVNDVYKEARVTNDNEKTMFHNLFAIYCKAISMNRAMHKTTGIKSRDVEIPNDWERFLDVRNKPFHGVNHYWKDGANTMIEYWPMVQLLLREIENVCESSNRHPPEPFAD